MTAGKSSFAWDQKSTQFSKPSDDDEPKIVDLFGDDETEETLNTTNTNTHDSGSTRAPKFIHHESLYFNPHHAMDLFDGDDGSNGSAAHLTEPSVPSSAPKTQLLVQVQNQEVDELQKELTRLREDNRALAEECKQNKAKAESWRRLLEKANSGTKIREALLEAQEKDILLLKNETRTLLDTVEQLGGTITFNNGRMVREREEWRKERLQSNEQRERNLQQIRELEQQAAKHDSDVKKCLNEKVKEGREWIKQYKNQAELRIRNLEEQCQLLRSNSGEVVNPRRYSTEHHM